MANAFIFANNVNTTLGAPAASSALTMTLASSANLPTLATGQVMPLTLNDAATGLVYEIVYVTAISGATLTVLRAQEGTTAQNWSVGDYAACMHTAQSTAAMNGNAAETFKVADAVDPSDSVNEGQLKNTVGVASQNSSSASVTSVSTTTGTLTAPCNGKAIVLADGSQNQTETPRVTISASLSGLNVVLETGFSVTVAAYGELPMLAGQSSTFTATITAGTAVGMGVALRVFFVPTP